MASKKAIGYVRSATVNPQSLAKQRAQIEAYCQQHDLGLVGIESDSGVSGMRIDRPGFKRLLRCLRDSKIHFIVMRDRSRLSRNQAHWIHFLHVFSFHKKKVLYVSDEQK